ncbi:MAG: hypothetical protein RL095_3889 [Verrucomicrobiota bacterium]|jgi:putative acetyltransferase
MSPEHLARYTKICHLNDKPEAKYMEAEDWGVLNKLKFRRVDLPWAPRYCYLIDGDKCYIFMSHTWLCFPDFIGSVIHQKSPKQCTFYNVYLARHQPNIVLNLQDADPSWAPILTFDGPVKKLYQVYVGPMEDFGNCGLDLSHPYSPERNPPLRWFFEPHPIDFEYKDEVLWIAMEPDLKAFNSPTIKRSGDHWFEVTAKKTVYINLSTLVAYFPAFVDLVKLQVGQRCKVVNGRPVFKIQAPKKEIGMEEISAAFLERTQSSASYPDALLPEAVGKYAASAKAGGGYVWDAILEYRLWKRSSFKAFATYAEAAEAEKAKGGELVALVYQHEYLDEPEDGKFFHRREPRITEWPVAFLKRPRRNDQTLPGFLAAAPGPERLARIRGES